MSPSAVVAAERGKFGLSEGSEDERKEAEEQAQVRPVDLAE
jgi:hypothetical protein